MSQLLDNPDFSLIRQCIQTKYTDIFLGLTPIIGQYYYKLVQKHNHNKTQIFIYIEKMGANRQFLIELDYKAHWYRFKTCSKYRNERCVLLDMNYEPAERDYIVRELFTPEYLEKKLMTYDDWQTNGHFLLNKLVNAYYNPMKGLCQKILADEYTNTIATNIE